jgi:hypothetical protein
MSKLGASMELCLGMVSSLPPMSSQSLEVKSPLYYINRGRAAGVSHRVCRLALAFLYSLPRGCIATRCRRADEGQDHFDHFIFSYPIQQFISPIYSPQSCR